MTQQNATGRVLVDIEIRFIGDRYLSSCPALDVASQGDTEEEAKRHLLDALDGFIETCREMGTLEEVLADAGLIEANGGYPVKRIRQPINIPIHAEPAHRHETHAH